MNEVQITVIQLQIRQALLASIDDLIELLLLHPPRNIPRHDLSGHKDLLARYTARFDAATCTLLVVVALRRIDMAEAGLQSLADTLLRLLHRELVGPKANERHADLVLGSGVRIERIALTLTSTATGSHLLSNTWARKPNSD